MTVDDLDYHLNEATQSAQRLAREVGELVDELRHSLRTNGGGIDRPVEDVLRDFDDLPDAIEGLISNLELDVSIARSIARDLDDEAKPEAAEAADP